MRALLFISGILLSHFASAATAPRDFDFDEAAKKISAFRQTVNKYADLRSGGSSEVKDAEAKLKATCNSFDKYLDSYNAVMGQQAAQCSAADKSLKTKQAELREATAKRNALKTELLSDQKTLKRLQDNFSKYVALSDDQMEAEIRKLRMENSGFQDKLSDADKALDTIVEGGRKVLSDCIGGRLLTFDEQRKCYESPKYLAFLERQAKGEAVVNDLKAEIRANNKQIAALQAMRSTKRADTAKKLKERMVALTADIKKESSELEDSEVIVAKLKAEYLQKRKLFDAINERSDCDKTGAVALPKQCA